MMTAAMTEGVLTGETATGADPLLHVFKFMLFFRRPSRAPEGYFIRFFYKVILFTIFICIFHLHF
jgi:hypothetical protein